MLKRYYLAFCLIIYTCGAHASFWSDVGDCFKDLCNCGQTDVQEIWNGEVKRTIKPGTNCPPWNKQDGRNTDNCLIQFDPPHTWAQFYLTHCAERTTESTYFEPKIRIRTQSCNAFACWHQSTTLKWDGDCIIWPGFYALPLLRICARIAVPAVPPDPQGLNQSGTPADPGYTVGQHLNDVGFTENDTIYYDVDGKEVVFNRPKLCAYSDPGLVNLVSATGVHIDPFDWNPVSQPLHKTTALSPIIKVLIFLLDQNMSGATLLAQLMEMIGAEDIPGLNLLYTILQAIGMIFELFTTLVEEVLRAVGSLNGSVDNYLFGCVELPFGPFPPPYCPKIAPFVPTPSTNLICSNKRTDGSGFFDQSTTIAPCVVSKTPNNIVHNTVRVGFDDLIPLCKGGENPLETDKCVSLLNFPISAKAYHTTTAQRDMIRPCTSPTDNSVCVNTKIAHTCNISDSSLNGCQEGFRIVYAQKTAGRSVPTSYFNDDLVDCNASGAQNATICQEVWGVNVGQFVDVPIAFPVIQGQTANDLMSLQREVSLHDSEDRARRFVVSIVRAPTSNNTFDPPFLQDPKYICVTEGNSLVGCEERVENGYRISTYDCLSSYNGVSCLSNSYYTPQFIASIEAIEKLPDGTEKVTNSTTTVVSPLSVNSSPKPAAGQIEAIVNLAGYEFSSFMADIQTSPSKYTAAPFSGANSLNPLTIHGTYKDGQKPYESSGKPTKGAVYLHGLEYVNGQYIQGGNAGCLQPKNAERCLPSINDTNCVLANLLEISPVGTSPSGGCKNFRTKNPSIRICNASDAAYCSTSTLWQDIKIYQCKNSSTSWSCYENIKNPGVEVCRPSMDTVNRVVPSPSLGPVINNTGQNYAIQMNPDGTYPFSEDLQSVRDKTSQELGLCVTVPPLFCPPITNASASTGHATWPRGEIGELVTGVCAPGYVPKDFNNPPQRYCLSNAETKTVAFESLPSGVGCRENTGLEYKFDRGTFLSTYPITNTGYNKATLIGRFVFGPARSIPAQLMCATYTFDIPDKDIIEYFKIGIRSADLGNLSSEYDDYLLITVNNQVAFSGPSKFSKMTSTGSGTAYKLYLDDKLAADTYKSTVMPETDILRYLSNTNNNKISICLGIVGGGSLFLNMEYKMKY